MSGQTERRTIQSVTFREGLVEIQFSDAYDESENIAIVKMLMFNAEILEQQVVELLSDIEDLTDAAIDKLRNPPLNKPGRRD